ncbi:MAG: MATE family efflux transporter, partial [Novosphingobium sp.]
QMAVFAVDVVFVARLGPEALAASSLSVALFGLLIWSMTGLVGAASPLIAAELGSRSHAVREVRRTVRMAGWAGLCAAFVAMAVCLLGGPLMKLTGQDPGVVARAVPFLQVLMLASIPVVLAALLRTVVATLGKPGIGTAITGMAVAVNALGNWVFVFGHFGAPELGLVGSAISSVVTSVVMLIAFMLVIRFDRRLHRYRLLGRWWKPEWKRFADVLRIGLPICGTIIAEAGMFNGAAFAMGRIGETELAAHTVALQFAAIAFQVPFGVGQAATIRVGLAYGARDNAAIALAGKVATQLGIGFMVLYAVHGGRGRLPALRRRAGRWREHAARPAGYARADAHCDLRLLGARRRHCALAGPVHTVRRTWRMDRLAGGTGLRRRTAALALEPSRKSRPPACLKPRPAAAFICAKRFCCKPIDAPSGGTHMPPAGTLAVRVPSLIF